MDVSLVNTPNAREKSDKNRISNEKDMELTTTMKLNSLRDNNKNRSCGDWKTSTQNQKFPNNVWILFINIFIYHDVGDNTADFSFGI